MSKNLVIERVEIQKLIESMEDESWKNRNYEEVAFDEISVGLLSVIYNYCKRSDSECCRFSVKHLSRLTRTTTRKVETRIKHLARYGLILVVTEEFRRDGSKFRANMATYPNPIIMSLLGIDKVTRKRLPVIQHYVKMGIERLDLMGDVQGFKVDCQYGYKEPDSPDGLSKPEQDIIDMIGRVDEEKAKQEAENALWRERDELFIKGAADVWVFSQSQAGYGQARPNWEGDISKLSPAARKERTELTKTFQKYGGRVTALAWYVFAGGIAEKDDRGNPRFSLIAPHRQFATIDKKPSQFAKHFNAVLKDEIFVELATKKWSYIGEPLEYYFGSCLRFQPRYDSEYTLIGFEFGG